MRLGDHSRTQTRKEPDAEPCRLPPRTAFVGRPIIMGGPLLCCNFTSANAFLEHVMFNWGGVAVLFTPCARIGQFLGGHGLPFRYAACTQYWYNCTQYGYTYRSA